MAFKKVVIVMSLDENDINVNAIQAVLMIPGTLDTEELCRNIGNNIAENGCEFISITDE